MKQIDLSKIEWHCDNCDALLNDQDGFDADCGTWKCEECGHENLIDESEIIWVNNDDDDEDEDDDDEDAVPKGCAACGGPYPLCKDGCPIFDDD